MTGASLALDAQSDVLGPIVVGITQGAVYGLVGLGLVLLYKSNRIFNFAQGEFGTIAAIFTFAFLSGKGPFPKVPYGIAALFGLAAGVLAALLTERLVVRPLFHKPRVTLLVATAGVALTFVSTELLILGINAESFPGIRPPTPPAMSAFGYRIEWQRLALVFTLVVLAALAALFFRRSPYGTAILAVSQEPTAASVVGVEVNKISALTWGIAGFLGGVAGILLAPLSTYSPGFMTTRALIPAFAAAVVGGITSLPGAFLGGILIGVVEQLGLANLTDVPGSGTVVIAATLLVVLLFKPTGLLGKET